MSTEMLKDYQCIDFKKLLLLKGKSIGLKDEETHILLLMMTLKDLGVRPLYPQKIAEYSSLSIQEIDDIMKYLVEEQGVETLRDQALKLVKEGKTTVDEFNKIIAYID